MKAHLILGAALASLVLVASSSSAQTPAPDAGKVAVIRQILQETHAADQIVSAIEVSLPAQRAANPKIPAAFFDRLVEAARAQRGELMEALVPVYARRFEMPELEALLAFYKSPLGRRLVEIQPTFLRDSFEVGQAWGMRIGAAIGEQLAKEGIQIQP